MAEVPQTDVSRPSALPTASLRPKDSQPAIDETSDQYLADIEEQWNKRVDTEVEALAGGMVDIVELASIGNKDKFSIAQEAYQAQCRAESMVRAAQGLLSIIHSMKLLLLLSDESQIASRRDQEMRAVQAEKEETKKKVAALLNELLTPQEDE